MTALRREHFSISRAAEYFRLSELQAQTGQPSQEFGHVILKELIDNALDAAESAGVAPEVIIEWQETATHIRMTVADIGQGIPDHVVERILDFTTRTSDKAAYRAPTRGALGNAWKTLVGIPFALGDEQTVIEIEGAGSRHRLEVWITPAADVKFEHSREDGATGGARVSISLPRTGQNWRPVEWVRRFAAVNPHATFKIRKIDPCVNLDESGFYSWDFCSEPTMDSRWRKFMPTDPTPASWYSVGEFTTLAHLKAALDPHQTVGDFASEFKGLSARFRKVARGRPKTIGDLVESEAAIANLHAAMVKEAKAPQPEILGRVGPDHLHRHIDAAYGVKGDRFWYRHKWAETKDGTPFLVEVAIAETNKPGGIASGLNFSIPFGDDPLAGSYLEARGMGGLGVRGFLNECGVFDQEEDGHWRRQFRSAAFFHLVMPLLPSLDRGKSRIAVPREVLIAAAEIIAAAAKELSDENLRWRRQQHREIKALDDEEKEERRAIRSQQMSKADAVNSILLDVYIRETENERIYLTARDLYYAIRPIYAEMSVKPSKDAHGRETTELTFGYFSQTIVPAFRRDHHPMEFLDYKARGWLILPHSGEEISIGDRELRDFQFPELETNKILFIEKDGLWQTLKQTGGIEFARRHDMAILAGQGFATVAMRKLLALASAHDWQAFAWHDADPSGYEIYRTLTEETRRMPDHRIDVFDLGLTVADAQEMGLPSEPFIRKKAISKGTLDRLTSEEKRLFGGARYAIGGGKSEWRCERFEINAIPVRKRVDYLERKLAEIPHLSGKVVPSDDRLPSIARDTLEERILSDIRSKVERRIDPDAIVAAAFSRLHIPEAYDAETKDALKRELDAMPEATWRHALRKVVAAKDIAHGKIDEAIDAAIEEVLAQKWREADG